MSKKVFSVVYMNFPVKALLDWIPDDCREIKVMESGQSQQTKNTQWTNKNGKRNLRQTRESNLRQTRESNLCQARGSNQYQVRESNLCQARESNLCQVRESNQCQARENSRNQRLLGFAADWQNQSTLPAIG